jgi:hypothetical protein
MGQHRVWLARRELVEDRTGTHGDFQRGHVTLHAKGLGQLAGDLLELHRVDFREREEQHEEAHQQ